MKPSPALFQKWSRAPYWGPEEGVALAFGLDPAKVVENRPHDAPRLRAPDPAQHFSGLARRAVSQGDLEEEAQPSAFLDWAEGVGLAFHVNWTSTLNPRAPAGPDGELETVDETVTRVSKFIEQRDELIEKWALAPTWTLREGACLANNVSPHLLSEYGTLPARQLNAERVSRLIEFALRASRQFQLSPDPTPAVFIAWSESVGFPFDPKWIEVTGEPRADDNSAMREVRDPIPAPNPTAEPTQAPPVPEQKPGTRTRETMLKLIIGLAIGGYAYDPRMRKSKEPGTISDDLKALGIPVTPETVRKYLDEGAKLLSPNALKNRFRDD